MSRWPEDRLTTLGYPRPGYDLPIFYNDLDTNGHLNNVALGRFFEQARFRNNLDAGMRAAQQPSGSHFLVARVAIDYLREGTYDGGPLHVCTRVGRIGTTSIVLEQAAFQGGVAMGLAETTIVHLIDGRPTPLTDPLRALMASMQR